jgi:NAD(P)H-flavin reductase
MASTIRSDSQRRHWNIQLLARLLTPSKEQSGRLKSFEPDHLSEVVQKDAQPLRGDALIERGQTSDVRTVEGVLSSLRPLSADVMEVAIEANRALPYVAGLYAQVRFNGYPSRPFSITYTLHTPNRRLLYFHVRRMNDGRLTRLLGKRIKVGHRVSVTGPFGSAHFRPNVSGRLILVSTDTGFAPVWSIAVAALREDPQRPIMVIAGADNIDSLYMAPALANLTRFPNVLVVPVCSTPQTVTEAVRLGRPTDYLPRLLPSDVLYAFGAPSMVDSVTSIAAGFGATCYAEPFARSTDDTAEESAEIFRGYDEFKESLDTSEPTRRDLPRTRPTGVVVRTHAPVFPPVDAPDTPAPQPKGKFTPDHARTTPPAPPAYTDPRTDDMLERVDAELIDLIVSLTREQQKAVKAFIADITAAQKPTAAQIKERYQTDKQPHETITDFIARVYGRWLTGEFTRADLRKIDNQAEMALRNWERQHGKTPLTVLNLPTLKERNDRLLQQGKPMNRLEELRLQTLTRVRKHRNPD